jgi:hypothetical protein
LLLSKTGDRDVANIAKFEKQIAVWCGAAGLRLASPRHVPAQEPRWILGVALPADRESAAA